MLSVFHVTEGKNTAKHSPIKVHVPFYLVFNNKLLSLIQVFTKIPEVCTALGCNSVPNMMQYVLAVICFSHEGRTALQVPNLFWSIIDIL